MLAFLYEIGRCAVMACEADERSTGNLGKGGKAGTVDAIVVCNQDIHANRRNIFMPIFCFWYAFVELNGIEDDLCKL
jgi:hypothetical protein